MAVCWNLHGKIEAAFGHSCGSTILLAIGIATAAVPPAAPGPGSPPPAASTPAPAAPTPTGDGRGAAAAADALHLTRDEASAAARELCAARLARLRGERRAEVEARVIEVAGARMPFWYTIVGEKPANGRSLWISLHGGGGAPAQVNDSQWENQKRLYRPAEGVYLAPRAPTDAWNMWHQQPMDALLDRLIEDLVAIEDVDPDRVYIFGYSAGGDGVYRLAPRMADRWAAAAAMAGHPGDARPDGLRNIGFALHTGELDAAYNRNAEAKRWQEALADLERRDPDGYRHEAKLHPGKGHWMDREDAEALPWMARFTRNPRPTKIVWVQDGVTHRRSAWLSVDAPVRGARIVVEREGQTIRVLEAPPSTLLRIRLDDEMVDLDAEVVVVQVQRGGEHANEGETGKADEGKRAGAKQDDPADVSGSEPTKPRGGPAAQVRERELFRGIVPRTRATMERTLEERGDPRSVFSAEVVVKTSAAPAPLPAR